MNWEPEQEKRRTIGEELLRRRQAMESWKQYAAHMRQMLAGMLNGSGYVRSADPAGRSAGKA